MSDKDKSTPSTHSYVDPKARAAGAVLTGGIESVCMWPFDKYKNVRMAAFDKTGTRSQQMLRATIGPDYRTMGPGQAVRSCFRGFPAYGVHKVVNRGLKLGCQPLVMEKLMKTSAFQMLSDTTGRDNAKLAASTVSGGLMGLTEVLVNPVDRMKILCQKKNLTVRSAIGLMQHEGMKAQYAGWKETACRNMAGTSTLFFGKFLTYRIMGLNDHNNPTFMQSFGSSMVGASLMLTVSHIPDVLKVRAQMEPERQISMRNRFFQIVKAEGPGAFVQGYFSKLISAGLKFGVVMTVCDMLVKEINHRCSQENHEDGERRDYSYPGPRR